MVHPSARIKGARSADLDGRRIVLGVCGSIAAVKCVELARELIRHGADVVPVMTPAATRILHPDALEFATGHRPLTSLSGAVEHVREFGASGDADLLLVAPATANTIAKMALGIDDTALTTFASVAIGARRPVVLAPAMHEPMEQHPAIEAHRERLGRMGVTFVAPTHEEGKAKLADIDDIVAACRRALGPHDLDGRRVLIITGGSEEPIDPVRVISNRSTGRMGHALAHEAYRRGAAVTILSPDSALRWPPDAGVHGFTDVRFLVDCLHRHATTWDPDWVLVPAALSDYAPEPLERKMSSDADHQDLRLRRLPKVLPLLRDLLPQARIVGWKLQDHLPDAITAAKQRLSEQRLDAVIANGTQALGDDHADAALVTHNGVTAMAGPKPEIARRIFDHLAADPPTRDT